MTTADRFSGLSLPASLLLSHPPTFAIFDQSGLPLDIECGFDPLVDPVVFVRLRDTVALMRWGERHAETILRDQSIPLWERQFFMQRGLMMQAIRLFQHRARFKRLPALVQVLRTVSEFLAAQPASYSAALSMTPPAYTPEAHAVGTGLVAAAIVAGKAPGAVKPESLMAPLLAGVVADVGLVDSHRNLLSFERAMTPPERNILYAHPNASARLIRRFGVSSERLLSAIELHHERIDGSGYPLGLGGDALPVLAQAVGLADAFMTLVIERPRAEALEPEAAIEVLSSTAYDPGLVATLADSIALGEHADRGVETAA